MRRFFTGLAIIALLGIVPSKAHGNDREIARHVIRSLQQHKERGDLINFNIELEVESGSVHLKGRVANESQEQLAIEIARQVEGVREVLNELDIVPAPTADVQLTAARQPLAARPAPTIDPANPNARELAERIYTRLRQEKDSGRLKGFSLDLEVVEGVATLKGSVASPEQRDLVLDVVRRIPGVTQVVNGLAVAGPQTSSNDLSSTVNDLIRGMQQRGELPDAFIDVQIEEGIVWISGSVADEHQRVSILEAVRYVPGVVKVVNDIAIDGPIAMQVSPASGRRITQRPPLPPAEDSDDEPAGFPLPLSAHDGPIGSSVIRESEMPQLSVPAPRLADSSRSFEPSPFPAPASQPPRSARPSKASATGAYAAPAGNQTPLAFAPARAASYYQAGAEEYSVSGEPMPLNANLAGVGIAPARYDHPQLPQYAWPSYAPYPNYGAVSYPKQYSPMAWPYIGPFYPYPQVPLGWRKATLEWKDGWWQLDFKSRPHY